MNQVRKIPGRSDTAAQAAPDPVARLIAAGEYEAALNILLPLIAHDPQDRALIDHTATCYWNIGAPDAAIQLMQILADMAPDDTQVLGKLGAMALSVGDRDGATDAFTRLLGKKPRNAAALATLNRLTPFARDSRQAKALRDLTRARRVPDADRALAFNALGRIDAAHGDTARAFRNFARAKAVAKPPYPAEAIDTLVARQRAVYDPGQWPLPDQSGTTPRLVFIVGLPRSGTTLAEAILSRHQKTRSIGESPALQQVLTDVRRAALRKSGAATAGAEDAWNWFTTLAPEDLDTHRKAFFRNARIPDSAGDLTVINKLPLNAFDLGFARCLLPDARFVFMLRHPLDTGLSCFSTLFSDRQGFSHSLTRIGHLTRAAYASLDDYRAKLGAELRLQSYRALVEKPDSQVRALVAHAGLDWDPACLSPEAAAGAVRTASVLQVRESINRKGLDTWRGYEAELGPLIESLGGQSWLDEWEELDRAAAAGPSLPDVPC
ncbi:tetratricopeptide repeat-containing sulfotransferase family protein [Chachezhania antarctica]|uniref:tetratricopeptide repeat-containing sulfotransferase family protein n=1 Tax=Chachezhania antarctica TaxID=2340860 RepID=UPI000EB33CA0|nr:sulfotransferase [Chachezhania antarctica]|tara:strand:+ start:814 stop:2292 length:1479 start_codon:yes stop_codon:yes gene_type:complete